ncbi:MAG TPA: CYTH domain-containing protein, partial [Candidatus Babeliaceae bacterium]|nr:CYTH domain-containing protein [Candidatus Babeliaceae bacterium]
MINLMLLLASSLLFQSAQTMHNMQEETVEGKEIEIKFTIPEQKDLCFKDWLIKTCSKGDLIKQTESYLIGTQTEPTYNQKLSIIDALNTLRVRETNKGSFLTFKSRKVDDRGKTICRTEFETKVDNAATTLEIYKRLGYEINMFTKERQLYTIKLQELLKDSEMVPAKAYYEIALDTVNFGQDKAKEFIEIELKDLPTKTPLVFAKQLLYRPLDVAGIAEVDVYDRGYIQMLWNPDHDFAERRSTFTG